MKKLMIFLLVVAVSGLVLAQIVQAAEKSVDLRQEVIQLCIVNADLADELHARLDKEEAELNNPGYLPRVFYDKQTGRVVDRIPTSSFFLMVADLIRRAQKIDAKVVHELLRHNQLLLKALENGYGQHFTAERIK